MFAIRQCGVQNLIEFPRLKKVQRRLTVEQRVGLKKEHHLHPFIVRPEDIEYLFSPGTVPVSENCQTGYR
jgi:hypothetical protein